MHTTSRASTPQKIRLRIFFNECVRWDLTVVWMLKLLSLNEPLYMLLGNSVVKALMNTQLLLDLADMPCRSFGTEGVWDLMSIPVCNS